MIRKIKSTKLTGYQYVFLIYEPGLIFRDRGTWKYLSKDHNDTINAIKRMFGNPDNEQNPTLPVDVFFTLYKLIYPNTEPNSPNGPPTYTYTCTYDHGYNFDKKNPRWYLHYIPRIDNLDSRFSIKNPKNGPSDQNSPLLLRYDTDNTTNNTTKKWICVQHEDEKAYIRRYFKNGIIPPGVLVAFSEHSLLKDIQNKNKSNLNQRSLAANPFTKDPLMQSFGAPSGTLIESKNITNLSLIKTELVRLKKSNKPIIDDYIRDVIAQITKFVQELTFLSFNNTNNYLVPILYFYNDFLNGIIRYENGWFYAASAIERPKLLPVTHRISNIINQIMQAIDDCVMEEGFIYISPSMQKKNNLQRGRRPVIAAPMNPSGSFNNAASIRRWNTFSGGTRKRTCKHIRKRTHKHIHKHTHKRTHRRKGTRRA